MDPGLECVVIDAEWSRIRDLAAEGAEDDAFELLREKLGSDGDRVMTPRELRTNVLVALSGFATGKTIDERVSAMHSLIGQLHDSYDWLRKIDVLTPVTDVQALIVSGGWVQIASIFRREFGRPDWGVVAADFALEKDPLNVPALTTKMAAKADLKLYSDAEEIFITARKINPKSTHLHAAWARIQKERSRFYEALKSALKVAAQAPSAESLRLVGTVYEEWGEIRSAVTYYKAAERIPPKVSNRETFALMEGYRKILSRALEAEPHDTEEMATFVEGGR